MRRIVVLLILAMAGCGGGTASGTSAKSRAPAPDQRLTGTVTVKFDIDGLMKNAYGGGQPSRMGTPCTASGIGKGYADLDEGGTVVVKNEAGVIIATGSIGAGRWTPSGCALPFDVGPLPRSSFYETTIGHRSPVTYAHDDLASRNWTVDLTLG